jgi:hypothetical protein
MASAPSSGICHLLEPPNNKLFSGIRPWPFLNHFWLLKARFWADYMNFETISEPILAAQGRILDRI